MPAAYARSKLTHLASDNVIRQENAARLTAGLQGMPGLITPYVPEDRTSVWHYYRIRFDPKALGINMDPNEFRARIQKALIAEGCEAKRWQTRPVQKQGLFLSKTGYGYGCPWTCPYGSGKPVHYGEEDFLVTEQILQDSIVFYDPLYPPNGAEVIDRYIAAFKKIWENMDEVLDFEIDMNDPAINTL